MSEEKVEVPAVEEVVEAPVEETPVAVVEEVVKPVEAVEEPTAITLPKEETTGPGLGNVADGVMGSTQVKAKPKAAAKKEKPSTDKVAVISSKNVFWDEVGKLVKGVNLVSAKDADTWIARGFARLATPEEVAKEYGI